MKSFPRLVLIIILFSCRNASEKNVEVELKTADSTTVTMPSHLMKGFELYAWKKEGMVYYTLLPGTNRIKREPEIFNDNIAVKEIAEIKTRLEGIAPGEYVSLISIGVDTTEIKTLLEFMRSRGLNLSVLQR